MDVAHSVQQGPPDAVDGHHNQGVARDQPAVQRMPHRRPSDVGMGFPGRCPTAQRLSGGWCGCRHRSRASLSLQPALIAPYLCDPLSDKLKGVTCGPVSQTRVCDPPTQADSCTWTAPELSRSQVSLLGLAGRIQPPHVSNLAAHAAHFSLNNDNLER